MGRYPLTLYLYSPRELKNVVSTIFIQKNISLNIIFLTLVTVATSVNSVNFSC